MIICKQHYLCMRVFASLVCVCVYVGVCMLHARMYNHVPPSCFRQEHFRVVGGIHKVLVIYNYYDAVCPHLMGCDVCV